MPTWKSKYKTEAIRQLKNRRVRSARDWWSHYRDEGGLLSFEKLRAVAKSPRSPYVSHSYASKYRKVK